jgi:hypothetical protein
MELQQLPWVIYLRCKRLMKKRSTFKNNNASNRDRRHIPLRSATAKISKSNETITENKIKTCTIWADFNKQKKRRRNMIMKENHTLKHNQIYISFLGPILLENREQKPKQKLSHNFF